MTVKLDLPAHVEQAYLAEARAKGVPLDELMRDEHFDAVFVATGAGLPQFLGVPGERRPILLDLGDRAADARLRFIDREHLELGQQRAQLDELAAVARRQASEILVVCGS